MGCSQDEIIFTSGGTESNNLAIKGAAFENISNGNHIITSQIEHPAVLEVCDFLSGRGFKITKLPVDDTGVVDPEDVRKAITPETILISIMHSNNEVGTIQRIKEISEIAHRHNIIMHTDAAQSIGKIPVQVNDLGADLLSLAGHKLYAPKGIGVLYIRTGIKVEKLIHGANHEKDLRAGTENVLEIVGLGEACAIAEKRLPELMDHYCRTRDELEKKITDEFPWVKINGDMNNRLPNTSSISFVGVEANLILSELTNLAVSAGAACHADEMDISPVLEAMRLPPLTAMGTIRFSTGRLTTIKEIHRAANEVIRVIRALKKQSVKGIDAPENEGIRLTQYTQGLGCACKMRPQLLEAVLGDMQVPTDKRIIVGTETGDDAAVFEINKDVNIVQTVDFFTPIVDNPYQFGAISAANSLSDIYAMGGIPLFALSIVGFPSNRLPLSVLKDILKGASDKVSEAGISIIGGHTIDDPEPKFGLAVTGSIDPEKILTNANAQPGDKLVLTKQIGTGVTTTGIKRGVVSEELALQAVNLMMELNKTAADNLQQIHPNACTDITGFGLLGHLLNMMRGSEASAIVYAESVPIIEGAYSLAASGFVPGGTKNNDSYTNAFVGYSKDISSTMRILLNDAQTSGGLLVSMPPNEIDSYINSMKRDGKLAIVIGEVVPESDKRIYVKKS